MSDVPHVPDPEPEPEPEPEPAPAEPDEEPETPEQLVTTTATKDYLNRALTNATPGVSDATDWLGRAVVTGNLDFCGRALVA